MTTETSWRALHLFVTSTFNDMHAERDHLRHVVFPELEQGLRARRVHLQVVDLRWGVDTLSLDEEAEREREVLRYCLDEVERCRPFQLVLLGDRYGYVPDSAQLTEVARRLGRKIDGLKGKSVTELEIEAGVLTDTGVPSLHRVFMRHTLDDAGLPAERLTAMSDHAAGRARGMPRRWRQRRWRRENHHRIPPNKRRQAVQRVGSTSQFRSQPGNRSKTTSRTITS